MNIVQYEHFGRTVCVREDLKGHHREHCLCFFPCANFKPNTPENCRIAQAVYELDVQLGLVTPVWECPFFAGK